MSEAPPQSIPDEKAVLGAVLVSNPILSRVAIDVGLKAEHFYLERHRELFAAIQVVAARDGTADELTVAAVVPEHRNYLAELTASVPAAGNAHVYARRLIRLANLRAKLNGAQEIISGVHAEDDERIGQGLLTVTADIEADAEPSTPPELAAEMDQWLEQPPDTSEALRLPWLKLNSFCSGGYRRGQMSLITGWSGFGKSLVLMAMLKEWAAAGHRNLLLTTEMDRRELMARYVSAETGIAYEKVILRRLSDQDWAKIHAPEGPFNQGIPFHYHDAEGWDVDRILAAIANKRPDVAAIDPWNLIPHKDRFSMDETARRLKEIAKRANCHVIVVAHLNTARMKDGKRPRPVQRDIRDSGMLYNNAHRVLCLHRDQNSDGKAQRNGELYFMKSRDGMEGGINVEFNPRFMRFDPKGTKDEAQGELDTGDEPKAKPKGKHDTRPEDVF